MSPSDKTQTPDLSGARASSRAQRIVVGNEKGGAGKSTVAVHLAIALMRLGLNVGVIDLDTKQASANQYLENRRRFARVKHIDLPIPASVDLHHCQARDLDEAEREERTRFQAALDHLSDQCDVIILDAPGSDTHFSRLAHQSADTLITPINDSFVDFALLADIDPETFQVGRPSRYADMVWQARKSKAQTEKSSLDWIVMRNRVSMLDARNKRRVGQGLTALSQRIGFRLAPGFSERVIYRELFPSGLTLLDLNEIGDQTPLTMSHIAARQELRELLIVLRLPALAGAALSI